MANFVQPFEWVGHQRCRFRPSCLYQYMNHTILTNFMIECGRKFQKKVCHKKLYELSTTKIDKLRLWQILNFFSIVYSIKHGFWKKSLRKNATLSSSQKPVPVLMNQNIQFFQMLWFISAGTFLWRWKCSTIQSCIFPKWLLTKSLL